MKRDLLFSSLSVGLCSVALVWTAACEQTSTDAESSDAAPAVPVDSGASDGGRSATADAAPPADELKDAASGDGAMCSGPAECSAGAPICCAKIQTGPGTPPVCTIESMNVACAAECPTEINKTCEAPEVLRLCAKSSDCTEPGYPSCCRFGHGGTPLTFCAPSEIEGIADECY